MTQRFLSASGGGRVQLVLFLVHLLPSLFFILLDAVGLLTICHEKVRGDSVRRKEGGWGKQVVC